MIIHSFIWCCCACRSWWWCFSSYLIFGISYQICFSAFPYSTWSALSDNFLAFSICCPFSSDFPGIYLCYFSYDMSKRILVVLSSLFSILFIVLELVKTFYFSVIEGLCCLILHPIIVFLLLSVSAWFVCFIMWQLRSFCTAWSFIVSFVDTVDIHFY